MRVLFRVVLVLAAATTPARTTFCPSWNWARPASWAASSSTEAMGTAPVGLDGLPIGVHGVAGEVEAGDVLLHGHPLLGGVLGKVGQDQLHRLRLVLVQGEEVKLPLQVFPPVPGQAVQEGLVGGHQLGAEDPHGVKGPGAG